MDLFKRRSFGAAPATAPDHARLRAALDRVIDPATGQGLVAAGRIASLTLGEDGAARCVIDVGTGDPATYGPVGTAARDALLSVPGVRDAAVALTGERPPAPPRLAKLSPELEQQGRPRPSGAAVRPDHVRRVLAVASGKGGVGKSTVAVNLALALARLGRSVGLLDADVYGPSAPRMLGLAGKPEMGADKRIQPLRAHGLKAMSMGLLVEEGAAMIWRGPMASQALTQMASGVAWGDEDAPLDVLIVDLPPGTGDVQLTLVQKVALDGVVIVSTPAALALDDARRAAAMFGKTGAPILGVVENMAWMEGPGGARLHPFGEGGAERWAAEAGLPYLGALPLDPALGAATDAGRPLTTGPAADAFDALAARLDVN